MRRTELDDLGVRPEFAGLLALADKVDEEKRAIAKRLEQLVELARAARLRGDLGAAAHLYDKIARAWRAAHFGGEADSWENAARRMRAERRRLRRKGKR
jgi:hypothetical protein